MEKRVSTGLGQYELRRFGITVSVPLALLAVVGAWRNHTILPALLGLMAASIGGAAFLAPRALRRLRKLWMQGAEVLGWVNTRLMLSLVYFLVITPMGVVVRLVGRDPLNRRLKDRASYWVEKDQRPDDRRSMELRF